MEEIIVRALGEYTRDPRILEELVAVMRSRGVQDVLRAAASIVVVEKYLPEAVTLGFSPQPLLAVIAARMSHGVEPGVYVVTSAEVVEGAKPARFSHETLRLFQEAGLVKQVLVAKMAPGPSARVADVIRDLVSVMKKLRSRDVNVIDVSGGTQFAPLAAYISGFRKMTYTYPHQGKSIIHSLDLEELEEGNEKLD